MVLVEEVTNAVELARVAVAFRGGVPNVKVGGNRGNTKAAVLVRGGEPIDVSRELVDAVVGLIRWARTSGVNPVAEAPDGLIRKVRRLHYGDRLLGKFVEPGWNDGKPAGIKLCGLVAG